MISVYDTIKAQVDEYLGEIKVPEYLLNDEKNDQKEKQKEKKKDPMFSLKLIRLRQLNRMTQQEITDSLHIPLSTWLDWEHRKKIPPEYQQIALLYMAMNLSPSTARNRIRKHSKNEKNKKNTDSKEKEADTDAK